MSCIVNCSVFCVMRSKTVLPWTILKVPECELSFAKFFEMEVRSRVGETLELISACAGWSKESLDEVDLMLQIQSVVSLFGPYIKYRAKSNEEISLVASASGNATNGASPFQSYHGYIALQRKRRNNKDTLYNHVIHCFHDRELFWPGNQSTELANKLIQHLSDVLWYIDGHHEQFSNFPFFFSKFQGYNKYELSKHQKRTISNLDHSILESHVNNLSTALQCTYWDLSNAWLEFKVEVCSLMESLYSYLEQLYKKQKLSATNHRRETPVRSLSDNMQLTLLPVSQEYHPQLDQLVQDMSFEKEYSCKFINDYTPDDPVKKFRFIQCLKNGINIPCMLFLYLPGSNIGNQYYLWKVLSDDDDIFMRSQQVVQSIRGNIPICHTRAMQKVLYKKYGQLCPSVKPAALRFLYYDLTGEHNMHV